MKKKNEEVKRQTHNDLFCYHNGNTLISIYEFEAYFLLSVQRVFVCVHTVHTGVNFEEIRHRTELQPHFQERKKTLCISVTNFSLWYDLRHFGFRQCDEFLQHRLAFEKKAIRSIAQNFTMDLLRHTYTFIGFVHSYRFVRSIQVK